MRRRQANLPSLTIHMQQVKRHTLAAMLRAVNSCCVAIRNQQGSAKAAIDTREALATPTESMK